MKNKMICVLTAAAALTSLAAGCGGRNDSSGSEVQTETQPVTTGSVEEDTAADSSDAAENVPVSTKKDFVKPDVDITEMRDISTMELVKEMGLGINLGNTFEACGS